LLQKGFSGEKWDSMHSICRRNEQGYPVWVDDGDFDAERNVSCVKVEFSNENACIKGNI
jgi:hypothetical protein